jgi:hypothetical protein
LNELENHHRANQACRAHRCFKLQLTSNSSIADTLEATIARTCKNAGIQQCLEWAEVGITAGEKQNGGSKEN